MTAITDSNIRYSYLHDPKVPDRVVTVARSINEGDTMFIGYTVNRVAHWDIADFLSQQFDLNHEHCPVKGVVFVVEDAFDAARGRTIAKGRLLKNLEWVSYDPEFPRAPYIQMLVSLSKVKGRVGRIAKYHLKAAMDKHNKAAKAKDQEPPVTQF